VEFELMSGLSILDCPDCHDKTDCHDITDCHDKTDRHDITDRHDKTDRHDITDRHDKTDHHEITDHHDITDRHDDDITELLLKVALNIINQTKLILNNTSTLEYDKKSESDYFQRHWESEYFFKKKNHNPPLEVKWSFP
jgi:peptidyl-prolyl isomerase G (cyclophilin G)